jgi:hypothetical protein
MLTAQQISRRGDWHKTERGRIKTREYNRLWYKTAKGRRNSYMKSAKHRNLSFELTLEDVTALTNRLCFYCGNNPNPTNGIDRQDNKEGYTKANSVPCCATCNHAKATLSVEVFLAWVQRVAKFQNLKYGTNAC